MPSHDGSGKRNNSNKSASRLDLISSSRSYIMPDQTANMFFNIFIKAKRLWSRVYDKAALQTALVAAVVPTFDYLRSLAALWYPVGIFVVSYMIHWVLAEVMRPENGDVGLDDRPLPDDILHLYY